MFDLSSTIPGTKKKYSTNPKIVTFFFPTKRAKTGDLYLRVNINTNKKFVFFSGTITYNFSYAIDSKLV